MSEHGRFYWNELMTRDAEKAKAFYAACMGWTFGPMEGGAEGAEVYWVALADGEPVGGIFTMSGPQFDGQPEQWMSYIHVTDVDAAAALAEANGATILRQPFDAPGVGRIAMIQEPGGAVIGWMTADFAEESDDDDDDDDDDADDDDADDDKKH